MYSKIFQQIFKSSLAANYELRHIFMDLLVLADRNGIIDMTYEAIARQTGVPPEKIVLAIGQFMKPDPESRSSDLEGARLVPLDPHRNWGWRIVNYRKYRNRQYGDEDRKRSLNRERQRRFRERNADVTHNATSRSVTPRNATSRSVTLEKLEKPNEQQLASVTVTPQAEAEAEAYKAPCRPPKGGQPSALVSNALEAKKLICSKILGGRDPNRPWSYEAQEALSRQLPIPRWEIERIAWFRGLPTDETPELIARRPVTERGLMVNWSDEVTRASMYWNDIYGEDEKEKGAA